MKKSLNFTVNIKFVYYIFTPPPHVYCFTSLLNPFCPFHPFIISAHVFPSITIPFHPFHPLSSLPIPFILSNSFPLPLMTHPFQSFPILSYLYFPSVLSLTLSNFFSLLPVPFRSFYPFHPFPSLSVPSIPSIPSCSVIVIPSHPPAELRDRRVMRSSRIKGNVHFACEGDRCMTTCGQWQHLSG